MEKWLVVFVDSRGVCFEVAHAYTREEAHGLGLQLGNVLWVEYYRPDGDLAGRMQLAATTLNPNL